MTCALLLAVCLSQAAPLWSIGSPDGGTRFALGPGGYSNFRDDAMYVVGRSDPDKDWPYVQPGPSDPWAGSRRHTFRVFFNMARVDPEGACVLSVKLRDTHATSPPVVVIAVNGGSPAERALPHGAGDASVFGNPEAGRRYEFDVTFSEKLLHSGINELSLTTRAGSWMLYDSVALTASGGAGLAAPPDTAAAFEAPENLFVDKRSGEPAQNVRVRVVRYGGPAVAKVLVSGRLSGTFNVRTGATASSFSIPTVHEPTKYRCVCQVEGRTVADEEITVKPVRPWVVYLLPHSHVDIGYTQLQPDVEKRQISNLDEALRLCEKTKDYPEDSKFKWNSEVLWGADGYLREADPARKAAFLDAVRRGDVGLQALYGNELTGLCRPEELIRLTDFGVRLRHDHGLELDTAMISDVPGYTWGLVPALCQSGVRYFSVGPNPSDRLGTLYQCLGDKPFWWVGPSDKDRVLCWVAGLGYAAFHGRSLSTAGEGWLTEYLGRLQESGYPYDMVQVRYTTGDNCPTDSTLSDAVRNWNAKYAYPRLVIATASRMFHDFEKAYGAKIPSLRGDITPYWEDGAGSSAWETVENRATADRLVQAEALRAMLEPAQFPATDFDEAWRGVVLYDEHTWGAYNSVSEPDSPFVHAQWKIKKGFADSAAALSQVLFHGPARPYAGEPQLLVANAKSWRSGGIVAFDCATGDRVVSAGSSIPSQRLADGRLAMLAVGVPAFGASLYRVQKGAAHAFEGVSASGMSIRGSDLTVDVDPETGSIASLKCASLGVDLVNPKVGINGYLYLPGTDLKDLRRNGPVKVTVKEKGPLVASLLIESEAPGCRKLTREVSLAYGQDFVEVIDTIDKLPIRDKEGVHLAFGFNVPNATTRIEIPWGVERPEVDQLPGSCKNWFSVQRWVDVSNDRYGVTVATPDTPMWEVGSITANLLGSQTDPTAWVQHAGSSATLYAWVMNNHWFTNYKADQDGPTTFRYMIRPHKAFQSDEAVRFGIECSQPPVALSADLAPRLKTPLLELSRGPILVSSLKPSRDGKAIMARLFNASDRPAKTTLRWRDKGVRLLLSDAGERPVGPAGPEVSLPAWGVVTLRAELR